MSILSSNLVWLLISYLTTKIASKAWGRAILKIGQGYLAARSQNRAEGHAERIDQPPPLTPEQRAKLSDEDRRIVDHRPTEPPAST